MSHRKPAPALTIDQVMALITEYGDLRAAMKPGEFRVRDDKDCFREVREALIRFYRPQEQLDAPADAPRGVRVPDYPGAGDHNIALANGFNYIEAASPREQGDARRIVSRIIDQIAFASFEQGREVGAGTVADPDQADIDDLVDDINKTLSLDGGIA